MIPSLERKHISSKKRSKWGTWFIGLAVFQVIIAIALLIPFLVNIRKIHYMVTYGAIRTVVADSYEKAFRISGEGFMFLVFEVWRLLLAVDGVIHSNSRTIYATAWFALASFGFSVLMIVESIIWIRYTTETFDYSNALVPDLQKVNQQLLIGLGCIVFLTLLPTYIVTCKLTKDFGWDVYKKIGSSIKIQEMFIKVQWFSLMLKIDIFFEFMSYTLWFGYLAGDVTNWTGENEDTPILYTLLAFMVILIPSYIMARIAISRESHLLVVLFIFAQILFFICTIVLMMHYYILVQIWFAFAGYCLCSLFAAIVTVFLSVNCQLNFNKGLKEFVQWSPCSKTPQRRQSVQYNNMNQTDSFYGLGARVDMPIDDE